MSEEENEKDKKNKLKFADVDIERTNKSKIILPEKMSLEEAQVWLRRKQEMEEEVVAIHEEVPVYPLDGAYAFSQVLDKKYGFTRLVKTPGFFGSSPPAMVGLEVGVNESVQVPWGRVTIPGIEGGFLATGIGKKNDNPIFVIRGEVKQKYKKEVAEIAQMTRDYAAKHSVYKAKAIRVRFPDPDDGFDPSYAPRFMDVSGVKPDELIFPQETKDQVQTSIFTPIQKTELCREHGVPLKRGVLLEGPFGVGKTLTADVAAKYCEENEWTFLYLEDVRQLDQAIHFASEYAPCCIFAEDIDRIVKSNRNRDDEVNDILNTIDGVDTKHSEVMVVLTTNNVEEIEQAMLRPGRLDAVISVRPPDAEAVQKLIKLYGRGLIGENADLTKVGEVLDGRIPSVIREVVERSKLACIARLGEGEKLVVNGEDLATAAIGMVDHLKLMEPKGKDERGQLERFGDGIGQAIAQGISKMERRGKIIDDHAFKEGNGAARA